jgi:hypothetical protein
MTIYILFDDCPSEWGNKYIIGVYAKPKDANKELIRLKLRDSYTHQYVKVIRRKLK